MIIECESISGQISYVTRVNGLTDITQNLNDAHIFTSDGELAFELVRLKESMLFKSYKFSVVS